MGIQLEQQQKDAVDKIKEWFEKGQDSVFVLSGLAGTGKTTIVKYFIDELGIYPGDVAFVAYTGKAAIVLTSKGTPATTIHRLIYKPKEVDGEITFELADSLAENLKLIVVDEASMVDTGVQADLESFGVPIIYIGDHGQIPPVSGVNKLMIRPNVKLEKIHRQAEGDPIIWMSKMARLGAKLPFKQYGPSAIKLHLSEVTPQMLVNADQVLCGKNATRHRLNDRIRKVLGRQSAYVQEGDKVVCLRNNWNKGYINGMIGEIKRIKEFDDSGVSDKYKMHIFPDQKAIDLEVSELDETFKNIPYDPLVFATHQTPNMKNRVVEPIDFAYAITVHKAQGSQWGQGLVIEEYLGDSEFHRKWLYTAITRFSTGIIIAAK